MASGLKASLRGRMPAGLHRTAAGGYSLFRRSSRRLAKGLRPYAYAGRAVECPFCGGRFRRFPPTGVLDRPFWRTDTGRSLLALDYVAVANRQCPRCGSSERHRLAYFYLKDRMGLDRLDGIRLLDVGPDDFVTGALFERPGIDYTSVDLSRTNATESMDVTDLRFEDDTFDCIICYHVLEHVVDDRRAMAELYRVMKPGGWGVIQVPIWSDRTVEDGSAPRSEYLERYGHRDHVRRYGPDYGERLESAGFAVTVDGYVRGLDAGFVRRHGLDEHEDVYLCRKEAD